VREEPQDGAHVPQEVEEEAEDESAPIGEAAKRILGEHACNEVSLMVDAATVPFS
jgi:hypothetical protein